MSVASVIDRRAFIAGSVSAAGCSLLPGAYASTPRVDVARLSDVGVIVDARCNASRAFGAVLSQRGAARHLLQGDPYRFIRGLLSSGASGTMAGMGTYADFIVLSGALREARYAMIGHAHHSLRDGVDGWPVVLAQMVGGGAADLSVDGKPAIVRNERSGVVVSWEMRSMGLRGIT